MKKLVFCGILSLFIGGVVNASMVDASADKFTKLQTAEADYEILSYGCDEGGTFAIVSTDTKCMKVYLKGDDQRMEGMIDH